VSSRNDAAALTPSKPGVNLNKTPQEALRIEVLAEVESTIRATTGCEPDGVETVSLDDGKQSRRFLSDHELVVVAESIDATFVAARIDRGENISFDCINVAVA
jgi:hypothetical protein